MVRIRPAAVEDVRAMDAVLTPILEAWGSDRPRGAAYVLAHYVEHPHRVSCLVAETADGRLPGFQSLKRAVQGNVHALPEGWGIIGTYVAAQAAGQGVGRALFGATRIAAVTAGLDRIDATIGRGNAEGLAYYEALGFRTWRTTATAIGKRFDLTAVKR